MRISNFRLCEHGTEFVIGFITLGEGDFKDKYWIILKIGVITY